MVDWKPIVTTTTLAAQLTQAEYDHFRKVFPYRGEKPGWVRQLLRTAAPGDLLPHLYKMHGGIAPKVRQFSMRMSDADVRRVEKLADALETSRSGVLRALLYMAEEMKTKKKEM